MYEILVDFNSCDTDGFVRLDNKGAIDSINDQKINLKDGMQVILVSENIKIHGIIRRPGSEGVWRAEFDYNYLLDLYNQ